MKLFKKSGGQYRLCLGAVTLEGNWAFVSSYMQDRCGIKGTEIEAALEEMGMMNHDVAVFNMVRAEFTHTCDSRELKWSIIELQAIQRTKLELVSIHEQKGSKSEKADAYERLVALATTFNADRALRVLGATEQEYSEVA